MADGDKPIIIVKKKGGHGGHHGGAWKVAYADFVTAMMAFFMVMWLLNSAESPTKKAIASYFRKPGMFIQNSGTPFGDDGFGILPDSYSPSRPDEKKSLKKWELRRRLPTIQEEVELEATRRQKNKGLSDEPPKQQNDPKGVSVSKPPPDFGMSSELGAPTAKEDNEEGTEDLPFVHKRRKRGGSPPQGEDPTQTKVQAVFEKLQREIRLNTEIQQLLGKVEVKMDPDGITIEIMDTEKTSMFAPGSARILPKAEEAFSSLVQLLSPLPNPVEVIGHTDATPFSTIPNGMTNWELSSARANEARKVLEGHGFDPKRINAVVGKADKELRYPDKPTAPSNRRITVRLKFNEGKRVEDATEGIQQLEQSNQQAAETPAQDPTGAPPLSGETPTIPPDRGDTPEPTEEPIKPSVKEYKSRTVTIKGPKMQEEPRKSSAIFKTTTKRVSSGEAPPADPYPVLKPGALAEEAFDPS